MRVTRVAGQPRSARRCNTGCRAAASSNRWTISRVSSQAAFPDGLAIPNPDLPNRDPLLPGGAAGPMLANVAAPFEALQPRAPLETWTASDPYLDRKFVLGLAALFAESDLTSLRRDPVTAYARIASHPWDGDTIGRGVLRKALGFDAAEQFSGAGKRHRATSPAITDAESTAILPAACPAGRRVADAGERLRRTLRRLPRDRRTRAAEFPRGRRRPGRRAAQAMRPEDLRASRNVATSVGDVDESADAATARKRVRSSLDTDKRGSGRRNAAASGQ